MSRIPIVDCHTHTNFSDGESTFTEVLTAAAANDCRVLAFTDHLTLPASMDPEGDVMVSEADLPARRRAFEEACELAAEIAPNMELVYGFECDWYRGCEDNVRRWSEGAVIRLGSVHWIGDPGDIRAGSTGMVPEGSVEPAGTPGTGCGWIDNKDDLHLWDELGPDEVWRRYVDDWCRACESPLDFDVMAHPDLAMRFANEGYAPTGDLTPLWDRMVECAHDTGRRIEVSTGGKRKRVLDYYPTRRLLERFCRAGVPITFGSDAHRQSHVCWGILEAQAFAHECGYRTFDIPRADGSWHRVPLGQNWQLAAPAPVR